MRNAFIFLLKIVFLPFFLLRFLKNLAKNGSLIWLTPILLLLAWFLGIYFSSTTTQPEYQEELTTVSTDIVQDPENCDEQKSLVKAKNCTVLVSRDDGGHGTGFSIESGYIITNKHVIEGAKKLTTRVDNAEIPLTLWNYSENEDLAILRVNTDISICNWANSQNITLAETLYAIGWPNVPEGESSITKGIYSRINRYEGGLEFIQTDAAINPGNSGGPLINKCGVVGINTTKEFWSEEYLPRPLEGLGNALASTYAKPIIDDLIKNGSTKKLPLKSKKPEKYIPRYEYFPQESSDEKSGNTQETTSNWVKARDRTREMVSYWNNVNSGAYDQGKLNELKDLLARMSSVVETIVPKMMESKTLSSEDNRLLNEYNSMYDKVLILEGQLDNQNYSYGYYHYECRSNTCVKVSGRGKNTCSTSSECQPKYHYTCQNMACVLVEGEGPNDCWTSSDCYHYECQRRKCVKVSGKGTNACYWDSSCVHNECQDGKCVEVEGSGTSACYSDYGCQ